MGVLKVIEVLSSSKKGWEDAAKIAVKTASKTVKNIRSVNISNQSAVVVDGEIVEYRLNVKMTFEVK